MSPEVRRQLQAVGFHVRDVPVGSVEIYRDDCETVLRVPRGYSASNALHLYIGRTVNDALNEAKFTKRGRFQ